jgi:hypothetical protein
MTPAEFQQLLITHAPGVPEITAAARRDDESPYGLTVTLAGGGRAWWTITGASPAGDAPGSGLPGEDPVPVPDLTGRQVPVAAVEQALIAVAVARAGDEISHIDRYSSRPDPPAVRYGATIAFRDGWKLFLSCYGTTRPGQPLPARQPHLAPPGQPRNGNRARRRRATSRNQPMLLSLGCIQPPGIAQAQAFRLARYAAVVR